MIRAYIKRVNWDARKLAPIKRTLFVEVKMKNLLIAFLLVFSLFSTSAFAERYILKFELKQVRLSLNPLSHVRDKINTIEFELPVDKEFYDSIDVGDLIIDRFRAGSFILRGSFSNWRMSVINKRIAK
jgi:hypothetical protein